MACRNRCRLTGKFVLVVETENHPEYPLKEGLEERLSDVEAKDKAEHRAKKIMLDIIPEFEEAGWYS